MFYLLTRVRCIPTEEKIFSPSFPVSHCLLNKMILVISVYVDVACRRFLHFSLVTYFLGYPTYIINILSQISAIVVFVPLEYFTYSEQSIVNHSVKIGNRTKRILNYNCLI